MGSTANYYLDADTGEEIMITDAKRLRCKDDSRGDEPSGRPDCRGDGQGQASQGAGLSNDRHQFLVPNMPTRRTSKTTRLKTSRKAGRPTRSPTQYSADLSLFVLDAGVRILSAYRPALMYLSTSDYVQHKHGPGEPESDSYHHAVDAIVGKLIDLGATVAITADHGMNDKSAADGTPNVIYLEDELNSRFGAGTVRVILPDCGSVCASPRVRWARSCGYTCVSPGYSGHDGFRPHATRHPARARQAAGLQAVRSSARPEGDFAVFSDNSTAVGARREDHNLSQLADTGCARTAVSASRKCHSCCRDPSMRSTAGRRRTGRYTTTTSSTSP